MLERYNDIEIEYEKFLNESLISVFSKCFNKKVWVCLYIPEDMYKDLSKVFGVCQKQLFFKTNKTTTSIIIKYF